jgi:hypothetical protein
MRILYSAVVALAALTAVQPASAQQQRKALLITVLERQAGMPGTGTTIRLTGGAHPENYVIVDKGKLDAEVVDRSLDMVRNLRALAGGDTLNGTFRFVKGRSVPPASAAGRARAEAARTERYRGHQKAIDMMSKSEPRELSTLGVKAPAVDIVVPAITRKGR